MIIHKNKTLYISKLFESQGTVLKQYLQHWSVEGTKRKFIVLNKNQWDPHPVNITNIDMVKQNYTVIAESERGCQIIEHRNTLATQFHIDNHYKEGIKILHNFIKAKINSIYANEDIGLRIEQAEIGERNMRATKGMLSDSFSKSKSSNLPNYTKQLRNSGFTIRKDSKILVKQNNSTNTQTYRPKTSSYPRGLKSSSGRRLSQTKIDPSVIIRNDVWEQTGSVSDFDQPMLTSSQFSIQSRFLSSYKKFGYFKPKKQLRRAHSTEEINENTVKLKNSKSSVSASKQFKVQLREDLSINLWKDKHDIRRILHPTLEKQYLPSRNNYIPGLLNFTCIAKSIKVKISPRFYSRK